MLEHRHLHSSGVGPPHRSETDPHCSIAALPADSSAWESEPGVVAGGTGSLLESLILGNDPSTWAAGPIGPTDGILVVIGMFGGNDGLNTVVPINDGNYYTMHGGLAVPAGQTLPLDGDVGLNPALTEFKRMWDLGRTGDRRRDRLPEPRSRRTSTRWPTGWPAVANAIPTIGLARAMARRLPGGGSKDLFAGAEVGNSLPLHLVGKHRRGTVVPASQPSFGTVDRPRSMMRSTTRSET